MDELLYWLQSQKGGVRTSFEFQARALDLRASRPEHGALLRLLADAAGRFAHAYDGQPLSVDVAENALDRLKSLVEKAIRQQSGGPVEQLALLNEISLAELD